MKTREIKKSKIIGSRRNILANMCNDSNYHWWLYRKTVEYMREHPIQLFLIKNDSRSNLKKMHLPCDLRNHLVQGESWKATFFSSAKIVSSNTKAHPQCISFYRPSQTFEGKVGFARARFEDENRWQQIGLKSAKLDRRVYNFLLNSFMSYLHSNLTFALGK